MDQTSTAAIPAAVRPPAALLALESTASASGSHAEASNYRVRSSCVDQEKVHVQTSDSHCGHQARGISQNEFHCNKLTIHLLHMRTLHLHRSAALLPMRQQQALSTSRKDSCTLEACSISRSWQQTVIGIQLWLLL